jgi:hypothetical protein
MNVHPVLNSLGAVGMWGWIRIIGCSFVNPNSETSDVSDELESIWNNAFVI